MIFRNFAAAAFSLSLISACAPTPELSIYRDHDRATPPKQAPLPAIDGYGSAVGRQAIPWTRADLAADFVELVFDTEWGVRGDRLIRWERPVSFSLRGPELQSYREYAAAVVARLDEATGEGLRVTLTNSPNADVQFRTASRADMREAAPGALCFFVPFKGDWAAFRAARARGGARWSDVRGFNGMTIFIPANAAPHEVRACIEEEAIQALGPGNDLYRLEDSLFNDDAAHLVHTSFDALMLRVLYDPAIESGMNRAEARAAAMQALLRAKTDGFGDRRRVTGIGDDVHDELLNRTYRDPSPSERRKWARRLIADVKARERTDHRLGEAYALAGLQDYRADDPAAAIDNYEKAEAALLASEGPSNIRLAIVRGALATALKREGRARDAIAKLDLAIPVLAANAHDRHLATALRWKAASLAQTGDKVAALPIARQALDWARYVWGADSKAVAAWREEFDELGLFRG